jgi:hypothetical protein
MIITQIIENIIQNKFVHFDDFMYRNEATNNKKLQ